MKRLLCFLLGHRWRAPTPFEYSWFAVWHAADAAHVCVRCNRIEGYRGMRL